MLYNNTSKVDSEKRKERRRMGRSEKFGLERWKFYQWMYLIGERRIALFDASKGRKGLRRIGERRISVKVLVHENIIPREFAAWAVCVLVHRTTAHWIDGEDVGRAAYRTD